MRGTQSISHHTPLTTNRYKFDLRLYVVVTSVSPLRVYLHSHGLGRFATDKWDARPGSFTNRFIHLTNYSVNKKNTNYVEVRVCCCLLASAIFRRSPPPPFSPLHTQPPFETVPR